MFASDYTFPTEWRLEQSEMSTSTTDVTALRNIL